MAHSEARAWWADVQHLRDGYEGTDEARRRADEADLAARRATRERHDVDAEVKALRTRAPRSPATIPPRRVSGPEVASRRGLHAGEGFEGEPGPRRGLHAGEGLDVELAPRRGSHADADAEVEGHLFARPSGHVVADPAASRRARMKGSGTPGRRTIEIRGKTVPAPFVPRPVDTERRRPRTRAMERVGGRPDRIAMWALLMGLMLILVAIGTADSPAFIALTLR